MYTLNITHTQKLEADKLEQDLEGLVEEMKERLEEAAKQPRIKNPIKV